MKVMVWYWFADLSSRTSLNSLNDLFEVCIVDMCSYLDYMNWKNRLNSVPAFYVTDKISCSLLCKRKMMTLAIQINMSSSTIFRIFWPFIVYTRKLVFSVCHRHGILIAFGFIQMLRKGCYISAIRSKSPDSFIRILNSIHWMNWF